MSAPTCATVLLGSCLLLLGLQGCRSPEVVTVYHQLHALAEPDPAVRSALQVEVLPVRLPDLLRRSQLVLPGPTLAEDQRWANGLDAEVQRVLVGNLAVLLGSEAVVAYPLGEGLKGARRVLLDLELEDGGAGAVTFQATWMLQQAGQETPLCLRKTRLREPLKDAGPAALVAAYDRALLTLAKEMAAELTRVK